MTKSFPKVIVIGETFRLNGGGGITMSNLFKAWPKDSIGVVTSLIDETDPNSGYRYYQLGSDEIGFPFPFNILQNKVISGEVKLVGTVNHSSSDPDSRINFRWFKRFFRVMFNNALSFTGLGYFFYEIKLSRKLKKWIEDFNPDIIYIQPFLHRNMRFGNLIFRELGLKYAIHVMDDSVTFINKSKVFHRKLQAIIERDFNELVANASIRMCISERMSSEYESRYGRTFLSFRNPIEIERWLPYQKTDLQVKGDELKIIYTGRLFSPTFSSLLDMCSVVDRLNCMGTNVRIDIFTYDNNNAFSRMVSNKSGVNLMQPVTTTEIPGLVQHYDIFYLCLDFDEYARKYSQYSISTRTSEGMVSSIPILMYGPEASAMSEYFRKSNSAFLVNERNLDSLEQAILELWHNIKIREEISKNALDQVSTENNATLVRERFRKALSG